MNYELINETIGLIDFDLIEAADALPEKAKARAFKPWLQWAAAAVIVIVIAVGTPLAIYSMGAFQEKHYAEYSSDSGGTGSEEDSSGVVPPADVTEPDGSSAQDPESGSSEGESRPHNASAPHGGSAQSGEGGGSAPNGGQTIPDEPNDPEPPQNEDPPELNEGEFKKYDMPAVTYRINGEEKTFVYQSSTRVKKTAGEDIDGSSDNYVVDHYIADDGATVSKNEASEDLIMYEKAAILIDTAPDERISAEDAIEIARSAVMNTDLPIGNPDSFNATVRYSLNSYLITFKTAEGSVEVHLDKNGELQFMSVKKDAMQHLSSEKVSAAKAKMNAKLAELNNDPNEKYILDRMYFEEWGSSVYAVFDVLHYPDKDSDEYSVYQYYCAV